MVHDMTKEKSAAPDDKPEKVQPGCDSYLGQLILKRDKEGLKRYTKWTKEHTARLRRLELEARGEQVPGEYSADD